MYNELFTIWKKEKTNDELQDLESDYYQQLMAFLTKIKGNKAYHRASASKAGKVIGCCFKAETSY